MTGILHFQTRSARRGWAVAALAGMVAGAAAAVESLRFEAETVSGPADAWQTNRSSKTHWNLWSTDKDANKKWSGGVVLQSPPVMADRASGGEGAPVLHTVITNLPPGLYDVEINRTRPIGVSFDGTEWIRTGGGLVLRDHAIGADGRFEMWVDDRFAVEAEAGRGACYFDYLDFHPVGMDVIRKILGEGTPVKGHAAARRPEPLDRGLVALRTAGGVYLSWRLLKDDPWDLGFDVVRVEADGSTRKLNADPVLQTTDFFDANAPAGTVVYRVLAGEAVAPAEVHAVPFISIKLRDPNTTFQKAAVVDLDGDGRLDFVLKTPRDNIDPAGVYWKPSPDTYALEAYRHDGEFLWRTDLGWAIERGIWYSPFVAWDLDGDGRAEVAAKIGEGDPRDADGRVTSGPEWLAVFDGLTGKELARAPWPDREGFEEYSRMARNQMAVAYLDGKTPCLLALRGTYGRMKVDAYEFHNGALRLLWRYDNENLPRHYRGQGAHMTWCFDADGDGRDEVLLGSVLLDDTGIPLWSTGLGHPDFAYIGDHNPARPGLEIFYGIESRARRDGMCMVDPATGKILWGFDEPTVHIHSKGLCADIDPTVPGSEGFALDCLSKVPDVRKGPWLWSAAGELLWFENPILPKTFAFDSVYWDADLQKEIFYRGKIHDYGGSTLAEGSEGSLVHVADILGDWREELIVSHPGELRMVSTVIPANDRRVCLLQDRMYRACTVMNTMGYHTPPTLSYLPEAHGPNLNATLSSDGGKTSTCQVVVSAPLTASVQGRLSVRFGDNRPGETREIDLAPGARAVHRLPVERPREAGDIRVEFEGTARYGAAPLPAGTPGPPDAPGRPTDSIQSLKFSVSVPVPR